MFTQEEILSHLEPVVFTLIVWTVLLILQMTFASQINALIGRYSLPIFIDRHLGLCLRWLESYTSSGANSSYLQAVNNTMESFRDLMSIQVDGKTPFHPLTNFDRSTDTQEHSELLALPTEILDIIVTYALAEYEDLSDPYPFDTCYRRPHHYAPRRTKTSLLRTCQFMYKTYWYLPWTLATHTFYLTEESRRPKKITLPRTMAETSILIETLHPEAPQRRKQINNIQIFPQLYMLEGATGLNKILTIPFFNPRTITITIRHTDWWWWESDEPMQFLRLDFVRHCRFPESTQCLNLQLESLERRKPQVNWMANHISRNWHFTRADNVHLVANPKEALADPETWKGCATWKNQRWIRDEDDAEPNVLTYYLLNVKFRAVQPEHDPEGYATRHSRFFSEGLCCDREVAEKTKGYAGGYVAVYEPDMKRFGIPGDLNASEVIRRFDEIYARPVQQQSNLLGQQSANTGFAVADDDDDDDDDDNANDGFVATDDDGDDNEIDEDANDLIDFAEGEDHGLPTT